MKRINVLEIYSTKIQQAASEYFFRCAVQTGQ